MHNFQFEAYAKLLLLFAFVISMIFFIITQQRVLILIRSGNRHLSSRQVWLQLIPLFGFVWQFLIIIRISNSIRDELNTPVDDSRSKEGPFQNHRPTYYAGILYATLFCLSFVPYPLLNGLLALAGLGAWIFYWVQLVRYKKQLKERAFLLHYST